MKFLVHNVAMNSTSSTTIPQSPRSHSSQPTGGRRPTRTTASSSYMQSDCGGPDSATEQNNNTTNNTTTAVGGGSPSLGQRSVSLVSLFLRFIVNYEGPFRTLLFVFNIHTQC